MIKMVTLIGLEEIHYLIYEIDPMNMEEPLAPLWKKTVKLRKRGVFAPAGPACRAASREQQKMAYHFAEKEKARLENIFSPSKSSLIDSIVNAPVEPTPPEVIERLNQQDRDDDPPSAEEVGDWNDDDSIRWDR